MTVRDQLDRMAAPVSQSTVASEATEQESYERRLDIASAALRRQAIEIQGLEYELTQASEAATHWLEVVAELRKIPADEPLIEFSDGTALLRTDKLADSDLRYWRKYTTLTPEQRAELQEYANHLAARAAETSLAAEAQQARYEAARLAYEGARHAWELGGREGAPPPRPVAPHIPGWSGCVKSASDDPARMLESRERKIAALEAQLAALTAEREAVRVTLALKLMELGEVPDPRYPGLNVVSVRHLVERGVGAFAAPPRGLTRDEVDAALAARSSAPPTPTRETTDNG